MRTFLLVLMLLGSALQAAPTVTPTPCYVYPARWTTPAAGLYLVATLASGRRVTLSNPMSFTVQVRTEADDVTWSAGVSATAAVSLAASARLDVSIGTRGRIHAYQMPGATPIPIPVRIDGCN